MSATSRSSAHAAAASYVAALDRLQTGAYASPAVYLVHGGRLRVMASRGRAVVHDGMPVHVDAATLGRAVPVPGGSRIREPVRLRGRVVGLLEALRALETPATAGLGTGEPPMVRDVADELGHQLEQIGLPAVAGEASPVALRRFARHAVSLTGAHTWSEALDRLTDAALDLSGMSSAVVVVPQAREPNWRVCAAAGPLTSALAGAPAQLFADLLAEAGPAASCWTTGDPSPESVAPAAMQALRDRGGQALAVVPLVAQGQRVGILITADEGAAHLSGTAAAEVLELLGALGAGALRTLEALQAVTDMATRDPLTGLGHHAAFFDDLRRALATPSPGMLAVLTVDVDHFKQVNDTFGHLHGDEVLRETAAALSGVLRGGDRAYRLGGDEFAALLTVDDSGHANAVTGRVLKALREQLAPVTVSMGLALARYEDSAESLVGRADVALYTAKRAGRDGVRAAATDPADPGPDVADLIVGTDIVSLASSRAGEPTAVR